MVDLSPVHEIANEKIAITKRDRVNPSLRQSRDMYSSSFIIPSCKIREPTATSHSYELLG